MNTVIFVGRLTADPQSKQINENTTVTAFRLAVRRSYKNAQGEYDADFIPCECYGKAAEIAAAYAKKGKLVGVRGSLRTYTKKDADGQQSSGLTVRVDDITLL